ncbi:MAG: cobaltochelatase subunit CobN [Pyrinomonadaceae bacterium]
MNIAVLYVGSSLLAPLRNAEREINGRYALDLRLAVHNFGSPFTDNEWDTIESDLADSEIIFVIHVTDGENAARLLPRLDLYRSKATVIVINCMPELMKRTRLGKLDFVKLAGGSRKIRKAQSHAGKAQRARVEASETASVGHLLKGVASWVGRQTRSTKATNGHSRADYLKWAERLPALLRFVPSAGRLRDAKNYLLLVSYFLQPTPNNIRSMILLAVKEYAADELSSTIDIAQPEALPAVAIYHPDAAALFETFEAYEIWYPGHVAESKVQSPAINGDVLNPNSTIGLLLMRPQIVSKSRKHYDELIRAIEAEGLSVIAAISTLMDNREACEKFFVGTQTSTLPSSERAGHLAIARVSQIVSLTGFSFVGGPAMNDSEAAADYLSKLNIPYRSLVSLDTQTIESWRDSFTGLNPVQTGMQIAIPEIDGGTEPFIFGGIPAQGVEPAPLEDRCLRIAHRLKRWNRLQIANRDQLKIALVIYCFPPNKGNIGTAADLDVFASLFDILGRLKADGYHVECPESIDQLRQMLSAGDSETLGSIANIAYRMTVDEYLRLCPFVAEVEKEWGAAPGKINSDGPELLIQGIHLGNIFIGVQPTFGFEDDPMRLLMAQGGSPHHGFAAFYTYLEKVFAADAVVHVGTHGALEFMPGKQVGLSDKCWPDRLIDELPNIYIYSVNNPSEGTIAKRRSYAQLISYLTPPIENAGLYKGLASLKELISNYRSATDQNERQRLYQAIDEARRGLNLNL